jgi:cytosine/adenosine deaminase-related metal-dependent hydrolase
MAGFEMSRIILTNALVVPMTEKRKSFRGYVRIEEGVIAEVNEGLPVHINKDEEIIDAAGCVLMPGLINAHTHLYQVLLRAVLEDLPLSP